MQLCILVHTPFLPFSTSLSHNNEQSDLVLTSGATVPLFSLRIFSALSLELFRASVYSTSSPKSRSAAFPSYALKYIHTLCQHHAKEKNMFINVGKYQQRLTRKCYYSLLTLDSLRRANAISFFCNLVPSGKGKKVLFLTYLLLTCNGRKPLCHGHCFQ